jgi:hypothetical protein
MLDVRLELRQLVTVAAAEADCGFGWLTGRRMELNWRSLSAAPGRGRLNLPSASREIRQIQLGIEIEITFD